MNELSCSVLVWIVLSLTILLSCRNNNPLVTFRDGNTPQQVSIISGTQIGEYVVEIFEDSNGNIWFGTLGKGVAKYNPTASEAQPRLRYFSMDDGLADNTVTAMAGDPQGNLWIGTHSGLSFYNGYTFKSFHQEDGLCNERVSDLLFDAAGTLWIATWDGVCYYKANSFHTFPLPVPEMKLEDYQTTMHWVTEILEDAKGNLWFCRDGYGVLKYDGKSFQHFSKDDGLASDNVQAIAEDDNGLLWFGSRISESDHPDNHKRHGDGGLARFDGHSFVQFASTPGLSNNEIYSISSGEEGNIWIGANKLGLYQFDGHTFTLYSKTDRADLMPHGYGIQKILVDRKGTIWLGLSGGLFMLQDSVIMNVTQEMLQ